MIEVTLAQILKAREDRAALQQQMLRKYRCPLVCFTMNIAGPVKNSTLIRRGFQVGLAALEQQIPEAYIENRWTEDSVTGNTAIYAVRMDATELKQICTHIEDTILLGRLFDMDVLGIDGAKLERNTQRSCIVCGAPGRACAAGRLHSVDVLQSVTSRILTEHFFTADREYIASAAVQSLLDEVNTTPKPGLVDRRNNGSHTDMNIDHFIASAHALRPYFSQCFQLGQKTATLPPQDTFPLLRQAGLEAERAMYLATGGINTHKGIIYTMGILCSSLGRLWSAEKPIADLSFIFAECAAMAKPSVEADFAAATGRTAGERQYLEHGLGGIRGEIAAGLPSISEIGLPSYNDALHIGLSPNDAGAVTLLHLIAYVQDTNLYHRGGKEGASWAAAAAQALLNDQRHPSPEQIETLDEAFISRKLSPGGCADLLAVTYFLHSLGL